MEIFNTIPWLYEKLCIFIFVFTRISFLFSTFILFRRDYVSPRIVVSLSSILALYVLLANKQWHFDYSLLSLQSLIQMLFQSLIGFLAGLILNIVFEMVMSFGQIISTQVGFSLVSLIDPKLGGITSLTHFYFYAGILIFLMMNGHLVMIKTIVDSFSVIPVGVNYLPTHIVSGVLRYSSIIFSGAVLLAIAVTISILLINFTLGIMTKFAPQFNLFSIGVNISLIVGLIFIYFTFYLFADRLHDFMNDNLILLNRLLLR